MANSVTGSSGPAGRSLDDFATEVGLSRPYLYTLPDGLFPEGLRFGKRYVVTEDPRAWLSRVKNAGGVPSKRAGKTVDESAAG